MLPILAWRNVWRSRNRSLVVIGAVILGVWAIIFTLGFFNGMIRSYINNGIEHLHSHVQVHHPKYKDDKEIGLYMKDSEQLVKKIGQVDNVQGVTGRLVANGMINTAKGSKGVQITGIDKAAEASVTKIDQKLVEGKYLEGTKKNPIMISKKMAEDLKVKIRSKVVLTFQDKDSEMVSGAFRIVGLFDTKMPTDQMMVYVDKKDLAKLVGLGNVSHQVAVYLDDPLKLEESTAAIKAAVPNDLLVESWREVAPDLTFMESQFQTQIYIIMGIILLALVFGIINTMLMAVLERTKELGMLMAIGMNRTKVFFLIIIETIMLTFIGAPIGMLLGFLSIYFTSKNGIDLSAYGEGLEEFGMSAFVYPSLDTSVYITLAVAVGFCAIFSAIYPSLKAISLKPVEALRTV